MLSLMRKFLVCILALVVSIVSGCWEVIPDDRWQTVYDAVMQSFMFSDLFVSINSWHHEKHFATRESLGIYSNHSDTKLSIDASIVFSKDTMDNDTFSSIQLSGEFVDHIQNDILALSGTVYHIHADEKDFIQLNHPSIFMWENNAEWMLLSLIIGNIREQWLWVDANDLINLDFLSSLSLEDVLNIVSVLYDISMDYTDIISISQSPIGWVFPMYFDNTDRIQELVFRWYAYLGYFDYQEPDLKLQWYIQPGGSPAIVIQELSDVANWWKLDGSIGVRQWDISINFDTKNIAITWRERRNITDLTIQWYDDDTKRTELWLRISHRRQDSWLSLSYDGVLSIALGPHALWHRVEVPIAWIYSLDALDNDISIALPTRYVLMSQLFGDEYGILSLLWSE